MIEYVRLTFKPAGAKRSMTIWAQVLKRGRLNVYRKVNVEGEWGLDSKDYHIIAYPREVIERPAVMSKKYGTLSVVRRGG